MRHSFILIVLFLLTTSLNAQESLNMNLLVSWDDDSLPISQNNKAFNDCWGYAANDREYAIVGGAAHIFFFDITDPVNFNLVAKIETGQVTNWRDIKTYQDRAYAVSDAATEGLIIFDLSDLPNNVTVTYSSNDFFTRAHNIQIEEATGRLYVCGQPVTYKDLLVYDIATDPDLPIEIGNPNLTGGYVHDLFVRDNIAYCGHANNGMYIYDLTDPANPIELASLESDGYNHSNWVSDDGNTLVMAEETLGIPLSIVDITNFMDADIELVNSFQFPLLAPMHTNNVAHNPFIIGDLVYVSYYEDGVQVFDISDPMNPKQVAFYDTWGDNTEYNTTQGCWGVYPFLPSGRIVASDSSNGLFVLELDESVKTKDISNNDFTIYPNPAFENLTIELSEFDELPEHFEIHTIDGKLMRSQSWDENIITVSDLANGMYLISLRIGKQVYNAKFVKG